MGCGEGDLILARREADELLQVLRARTVALVERHFATIERIGAALAERDLSGSDVDALIEQARAEEAT